MKKFKLAAIVAVSLSVAQPTLAAVGGVKASFNQTAATPWNGSIAAFRITKQILSFLPFDFLWSGEEKLRHSELKIICVEK